MAGMFEKGGYFDQKSRAIDKKADVIAEDFKEATGITDRESGRLAQEQRQRNVDQGDEMSGVLNNMSETEDAYVQARDPAVQEYKENVNRLREQSQNQSADARSTYTNTIQPELKNLMETEKQNAAGAMTLQQSMDPNNAVAEGTRSFYNTQAQNEGKAGLAASGVLANLGANAFSQQMGAGMPMTGGQMQLLAAQSQQQGADAYARTQQRMQNLRDQGLERGFERSDLAYNRGLDARDRYRRGVGDIEGAEDRFHQGQKDFRQEDMGYGRDIFGTDMAVAGQDMDIGMGRHQRDMGEINRKYGAEGAARTAESQASAAGQAGRMGITTGAITGGLTAVGAIYGGPQGAQVGNAAGQAVSGGVQGQAAGAQAGNNPQSYQAPPPQQPYGGGVGAQNGYGTTYDPRYQGYGQYMS